MCVRPNSLIFLLITTGLVLTSVAIDPPASCRFLNTIHDSTAEKDLVDFFEKSEPFVFKETNYFQPQCLLCESLNGKLCFGYKSGTTYYNMSGAINSVQIVTNLPYIYSTSNNIGANNTVVYAVGILRENLAISYNTLLRFKGITTLDPIVMDKPIRLRLCLKCLPGDMNEYSLNVTGDVYRLTVRLFINKVAVNASNGILIDGNIRAKINCRDESVKIESKTIIPDETFCSIGSCLGSEFCLTYQPEYAPTRETWCPLTEKNWISSENNSIRLSPSDMSLPLHIQMEQRLLRERPFTLLLNPNWFIDYPGVLTLSVPEATPGYYHDPIWKIVLPTSGQPPSNSRIFLLYNCHDVQIRFSSIDTDYFQRWITFVDMKTNSTFTIKDISDKAKQLCNENILISVGDSTTVQPTTQITNYCQSFIHFGAYSAVAKSLRLIHLLLFSIICSFLNYEL